MATQTRKKLVSFDKAGMLGFPSINEALKYFSDPKNGGYSSKAIVWLYQETYEIRIGNLSINMAAVIKDEKTVDKLLGDVLKNPKLAQKVKIAAEKWVKENDPKKADNAHSVKNEVKNAKSEAVKLNIDETPTA